MPATETLTFLFTDIQGSTRIWESESDSMREALESHDTVLRGAFAEGEVFKHTGDGMCVAFGSVSAALTAAVEAQLGLARTAWPTSTPLRVRIGIHSGEARRREGDFFGTALNRTARVMDAGHGGQILVTAATASLAGRPPSGLELSDLGEHRLKDLGEPVHLYQVTAPGIAADFPQLRSVESYATNLPTQLSSFVGREAEVAEVLSMLEQSRLVTLTGVGGVGKTRLAIQAAAEGLDWFDDGVWLVELAPVSEPALLRREIADALGVAEEAGRSVTDVLIDHLRDRSLLLVMDNCEHLIDEAAKVAEMLLRAAPDLKMIATSREGLAIAGERLWMVPSMTRSGSTADAVALFAERARLIQPSFVLDESNEAAVDEICTRLDGIPLAIELATARLKVFPPQQIAERLGDRFRLLTGGSRTALPRQRTLQATMDWSYDLLGEHHRTLLRRLSVFHGGFEFESAEQVCGVEPIAPYEVLDLLTHLIECSLVLVDERRDARYALLETVRQYGLDRLVESGEADDARRRHAEHFAELAEQVDDRLLSVDADPFMARLKRDHDNVRAALTWAIEADEPDLVLRLAEGMGRFWFFGAFIREGAEWLARALRIVPPQDTVTYSEMLSWAGTFAIHRGQFAEAEGHLDESLAIAERLGDPRVIARSLNGRGNLDLARGNLGSALEHYEGALEDARDNYRGVVLVNIGFVYAWMGEPEHANRAADEIDQSFADNWAWALSVRAFTELTSGTLESAERVHRDAYERLNAAGERVLEAWTMIGLAEVERRLGDLDAALDWVQRAARLGREIGAGSTDWLGRIGSARVHLARDELDATREDITDLVDQAKRNASSKSLAYAAELAGRLSIVTGNTDEGVRLIAASDHRLAEGRERRATYLDEEVEELLGEVAAGRRDELRAEGHALSTDELMERILAV